MTSRSSVLRLLGKAPTFLWAAAYRLGLYPSTTHGRKYAHQPSPLIIQDFFLSSLMGSRVIWYVPAFRRNLLSRSLGKILPPFGWPQQTLPKHWHVSIKLHGSTTATFIVATRWASNFHIREHPSENSFRVECCKCTKAVFRKGLSLADSLCLRKVTTDPHILAHVNTDDQYSKLKICISELIFWCSRVCALLV